MAQKLFFSTQGSGKTIIFIHGWGLNHGVWQAIAPLLADQYQVKMLDLPGFGNSQPATLATYNLIAVVETIAEYISEPSIICGWSLGGLVATQLALSYPEKVSHLITVASSPYFVEQQNWPGIKPLVLNAFHQQLSDDTQKTIANFLKIQAMGSPHIRHDIKQLHQAVMQFPQPARDTLEQSLQILEQADLRQQLNKISQPVLRIYGALDNLVPKAVWPYIDDLLPKSQVWVEPKASHAPFISHPDSFVAAIRAWLNKQNK